LKPRDALRSLIAAPIASPFNKARFSVRLKRRFSVPACGIRQRRAQLRSRLAEGHREAARSGLDGSEHGATLDQAFWR
jgi:hypothetical protein